MNGDRVEALVDTGQGVQAFEITATRAGRRIEVVSSRGVVEVREVTSAAPHLAAPWTRRPSRAPRRPR